MARQRLTVITGEAGGQDAAVTPDRHSRESGNPEMQMYSYGFLVCTVLDSPFRGNDG